MADIDMAVVEMYLDAIAAAIMNRCYPEGSVEGAVALLRIVGGDLRHLEKLLSVRHADDDSMPIPNSEHPPLTR